MLKSLITECDVCKKRLIQSGPMDCLTGPLRYSVTIYCEEAGVTEDYDVCEGCIPLIDRVFTKEGNSHD